MGNPRRHGLGAAFGYAFAGFVAAWNTQRNLRIQAGVAVVTVIAGLAAHLTVLVWAIVVLTVASVVVAELLNTAVEAVVDLAAPHEHPLAKRAKDIAAAAVLAASLAAAVVGALVVTAALRHLAR